MKSIHDIWPFKRKVPAPTPKWEFHHRLWVHFTDGTAQHWYFSRDKNLGPIALWKPFVKWYFGTPKPDYLINVPGKRILLRRERIAWFVLDVVEEELS